jgi:hypothetical protein
MFTTMAVLEFSFVANRMSKGLTEGQRALLYTMKGSKINGKINASMSNGVFPAGIRLPAHHSGSRPPFN